MVNGFCTGWGELTEMKPEDFNQRSLEWFRFTYLYMLAVCYFNCGWLHVLLLRSLFIIKRNSCFRSLCKVEWILSVFGVCALTLAPNRMWNSDLSAKQHVQNNNINNWNFMYDVHRNKWLNERMNERTNRDRWMKRDRKENHTSKMLKFSYWFQDCRFFLFVSRFYYFITTIKRERKYERTNLILHIRVTAFAIWGFSKAKKEQLHSGISLGWNSLSL